MPAQAGIHHEGFPLVLGGRFERILATTNAAIAAVESPRDGHRPSPV